MRNERTWSLFLEHVLLSLEINGPGSHIKIAAHLGQKLSSEDQLRLYGLYGVFYSAVTAWAALQTIPSWSTADLLSYCAEHRSGLPIRRERKVMRQPKQMAECMASWEVWSRVELPALLAYSGASPAETYRHGWEKLQRIRFFGRYINIRMAQLLARGLGWAGAAPGVHARGGSYLRKSVGVLYPQHAHRLAPDTPYAASLAERLACEAYDWLADKIPRPLGMSELQALICEFRQAMQHRGFYPGASYDEELEFAKKIEDYWGDRVNLTNYWDARLELAPISTLGEHRNWDKPRINVRHTTRDYGYVWSDERYVWSPDLDAGSPAARIL